MPSLLNSPGKYASALPGELTARVQWLVWCYEERNGRRTKVPYQCMGYKASVTNPNHWSRFDYAVKTWQARRGVWAGIGYVFSPDDPFSGIDLDQCLAEDGTVKRWARKLLERFSDTYAEVSPSGSGIKIWCRAKPQRALHCALDADGSAIEVYGQGRFFAVTGARFGEHPGAITDHQADVDALLAELGGGSGPVLVTGEKIPYGSQHNTLVSWAGTMYRRGICTEAIEAALLVVNEKQCERPGPEENIRRIARSIERWSR